jgi:hypothetical protein
MVNALCNGGRSTDDKSVIPLTIATNFLLFTPLHVCFDLVDDTSTFVVPVL